MIVKIQKKDGSQEEYDRNKLVSSCMKAGAGHSEAEQVASQVETWLSNLDQVSVKSEDLRNKVYGALRSLNPSVAATFEAFRKPE